MTKYATLVTALLLTIGAVSIAAADADKHSGTWKMNPAKSKYKPGSTTKDITLKVEMDGNSMKINSEGTNADGTPIKIEYDAKLDGKDYTITGVPNADKVSVKRLGPNAIEATVCLT